MKMDGILSAKPFNVLYKQAQFYSVICVMIIIHSLIRCPNVNQSMSPVQSHALLDLQAVEYTLDDQTIKREVVSLIFINCCSSKKGAVVSGQHYVGYCTLSDKHVGS